MTEKLINSSDALTMFVVCRVQSVTCQYTGLNALSWYYNMFGKSLAILLLEGMNEIKYDLEANIEIINNFHTVKRQCRCTQWIQTVFDVNIAECLTA